VIDGAHAFKREAASDALIDGGGVEEPIKDDEGAGFQQWADFFADELSAAGGEEQKLGLRGHGCSFFGVLKEMADAFAKLRAAGLTQDHDNATRSFEPRTKQSDLRGLAAAFRAFER
jgi:hypothetical protein